MPTSPRVCVIIACFDAERHLSATLESVRDQSYVDWECIVVDDGSTDASAQLADRLARDDSRFRVLRQANGGVSRARNAGLAAAADSVEFVAFLDADDVWTPDALRTLVDTFDRAPGCVGVYGLAEYMDEEGRPVRPGDHPAVQADRRRMGRLDLVAVPAEAPTTFSSLLVAGTMWPAGIGLHRRADVVRAGGFDVDITRAEDWELYLRMSRFGVFAPIATQVVWYRRHGDNATASLHTSAMAEAVLQVRWRVESSGNFSTAQRREAGRVWRRLAGRWTLWTLTAGLRALRRGDRSAARDAFAAALHFARRSRRPVAPEDTLVRHTVRYVVDRSRGAGGPLP